MFNLKQAVEAAAERIGPHIVTTPVVEAPSLSSELGCEVLLKLENIQKTGSFKIRGALNKILQLTEAEKAAGIVTASSGNHGAAVAKAAQLAGGTVDIYVPEGASPAKIANMQRLGGTVHVFGSDSGKSEQEAQRVAKESGATYVSPYNDPDVIAGQGTIGLELARQVPDMDVVIIAVGGGGLASGIAGYLKAVNPKIETIGAAPAASAAMIASIEAGEIVETPHDHTLSDGTAGGLDEGSITFPLCRDNLDTLVRVDETAIEEAFRDLFRNEHMLVEGAAAVTLAALRREAPRLKGKKVVLILCGANISPDVVKSLL